MCLECIHLVETVLAVGPVNVQAPHRPGEESERLGHPLTERQKLEWVLRWLPLTPAVMDLGGTILAAEREPAQR